MDRVDREVQRRRADPAGRPSSHGATARRPRRTRRGRRRPRRRSRAASPRARRPAAARASLAITSTSCSVRPPGRRGQAQVARRRRGGACTAHAAAIGAAALRARACRTSRRGRPASCRSRRSGGARSACVRCSDHRRALRRVTVLVEVDARCSSRRRRAKFHGGIVVAEAAQVVSVTPPMHASTWQLMSRVGGERGDLRRSGR